MRILKKPVLLGGLLVLMGGLLFLNMIGIHVGWIARIILSALVIAGGWKLYHTNGSFRKLIGACLVLFGLLSFVGLLHIFIALAAAVFLIYAGWNMIKRNRSATARASFDNGRQTGNHK